MDRRASGKVTWLSIGQTILRLIVAISFVYAGWSKLRDLQGFGEAIYSFGMLSAHMASLVGSFLPWMEVVAGLGLMLPIARRGATLLIGLMLVVYMAALAIAWRHGLAIHCDCFGSGRGAASPLLDLARDVALLGVLVLGVLPARRHSAGAIIPPTA